MVGADVTNILQLPTEGGEHTLIQSKRLGNGLLVLPVLQIDHPCQQLAKGHHFSGHPGWRQGWAGVRLAVMLGKGVIGTPEVPGQEGLRFPITGCIMIKALGQISMGAMGRGHMVGPLGTQGNLHRLNPIQCQPPKLLVESIECEHILKRGALAKDMDAYEGSPPHDQHGQQKRDLPGCIVGTFRLPPRRGKSCNSWFMSMQCMNCM